MSIGTILIGAAMLVMAGLFVTNPLLSKTQQKGPVIKLIEAGNPGDRHTELLLALRDLEFDHRTGKVSEEDYTGLRQTLLVKAAVAMEAQEKQEAELNDRIEQAIQKRREKQSSPRTCIYCGITLEASDHFCRACGKAIEMVCPICGEKMLLTDMFCSRCGTPSSTVKIPAPAEGA